MARIYDTEGRKRYKNPNVTTRLPKVEIPELHTIVQGDPGCAHYWSIEMNRGPVSLGTCNLCGAKQEFLNFFPTMKEQK